MARSRDPFGEAAFPHFLTCTVVGWLPFYPARDHSDFARFLAVSPTLRQKLEYIHNNPVKRGYVSDPTDWRYSSARNYARIESLVGVTTDW